MQDFETLLKQGKINSLGHTEAVVDAVLDNPQRLEELYQCFKSEDEWARMRTASAWKRVSARAPKLVAPYLDKLLEDISQNNQPSIQWTLALIFDMQKDAMSADQKARAKEIMLNNLRHHQDWIVICNTIGVLAAWSKDDEALKASALPEIKRHQSDPRNSVSRKARKALDKLNG